jgi:hypothetical protein
MHYLVPSSDYARKREIEVAGVWSSLAANMACLHSDAAKPELHHPYPSLLFLPYPPRSLSHHFSHLYTPHGRQLPSLFPCCSVHEESKLEAVAASLYLS